MCIVESELSSSPTIYNREHEMELYKSSDILNPFDAMLSERFSKASKEKFEQMTQKGIRNQMRAFQISIIDSSPTI